jgi:hypothetical protein
MHTKFWIILIEIWMLFPSQVLHAMFVEVIVDTNGPAYEDNL